MEPVSRTPQRLPLLALSLLLLPACAHYPVNSPRSPQSPEYRLTGLSSTNNSDDLLVLLAFSGGGTRAASLAYGVMKELARTTITYGGSTHRLLDEVDLISSVSGGCFPAAYYCLHGDDLFAEFEPGFLKRDIQTRLACQYFKPRNWWRAPSRTFSSSDLAAEYYGRHLFDHATFGDLARQGRKPLLLINATDVSLGTRFTFEQDQFDLICSDLSTVPIARAVAASSAFPGILSPITLKNHADACDNSAASERLLDRDQAAQSSSRASALHAYLNTTNHPYIHLVDGGVSDNLGLRAPLEHLLRSSPDTTTRLSQSQPRKLIVIVVDSTAEHDFGWQHSDRTPSALNVLLASGIIPVRRYSQETVELFRDRITSWANPTAANEPSPEIYFISVGLNDLEDEDERRRLLQLRTNYTLPSPTVDRLIAAAASLLRNSTEFQRLLADLSPRREHPARGRLHEP